MKTKRKTVKQMEEMLGNFDLLLWCVEEDCGKDSRLSALKKKVVSARKELHNVPKKVSKK